jgi:hypothetical protein
MEIAIFSDLYCPSDCLRIGFCECEERAAADDGVTERERQGGNRSMLAWQNAEVQKAGHAKEILSAEARFLSF